MMAAPITSPGRFSPRGPLGISDSQVAEKLLQLGGPLAKAVKLSLITCTQAVTPSRSLGATLGQLRPKRGDFRIFVHAPMIRARRP